ncbi:uncharacterized protein LOC110607561 [Manihot esculenta]|uniref:DUF740 family protein n=1 Tax=Manihot esculenta TaxID=3983 RepID=A0A2C9WFZ1_MANES|nr:uncharacterized protein LOC110607561 [Manihot esculenta]OAY58263.1 hypothetical protein MANES_02G162900v8 [Manihot esculenta]
MNGHRDENSCCYFHPKQVLVGVCPLCLNERLLVLAAKQGQLPSTLRPQSFTTHARKPSISFPKIFAFDSLLNRLEFRHGKSSHKSDASTSQEESFISIKFEDNGAALWEKGTVSNKVTVKQCTNSGNHNLNNQNKDFKQPEDTMETISEMHNTKPRSLMRWRKRIGHVFQVIRWKSSKRRNDVGHVSTEVEGVKERKSWIRTLTKRRT